MISSQDGKGFVLAIDPETSKIVREVVRRVSRGEPVNAVVADLNKRKVQSPRDRVRALAQAKPDATPPERPRDPGVWQATSMRKILRSRTLRGEVMHRPVVGKDDDGNEVRGPTRTIPGANGMPLTRAEQLIKESEWAALQRALDGAAHEKKRWQTPSGLLGVGYCAACAGQEGGPAPLDLWQRHKNGKVYSYYRCYRAYRRAEHPGRCSTLAIRQELLDDLAERNFPGVAGPQPVCEKVPARRKVLTALPSVRPPGNWCRPARRSARSGRRPT